MDAEPTLSRRALLARAARAGAGAAVLPLASLMVACGQTLSSRSPAHDLASTPTAGASSTAGPQPAPTPDTRQVTIAITGDVMLGRSVNTQILGTADRYPFNFTADYLHGFDLTVGNLECVVSSQGQPVPNKQYHFRADPRGFTRLNDAGFSIVSLANNHSGDFGRGAFIDMLAQLPAHGITPLGGGATLAAAHQPVIRTIRSTTVGFLAYCEIGPDSFAATRATPGHAWLDPALMHADIVSVRPHVDYLVVFMHWGIEYQRVQTGHQQAIARLAVEAGADFVVGSHPHVIQPFEIYQGRPIVYSLGNFVFDEMLSDDVRRGEVLALTIQGSTLVGWTRRQSYIAGTAGQPQWA